MTWVAVGYVQRRLFHSPHCIPFPPKDPCQSEAFQPDEWMNGSLLQSGWRPRAGEWGGDGRCVVLSALCALLSFMAFVDGCDEQSGTGNGWWEKAGAMCRAVKGSMSVRWLPGSYRLATAPLYTGHLSASVVCAFRLEQQRRVWFVVGGQQVEMDRNTVSRVKSRCFYVCARITTVAFVFCRHWSVQLSARGCDGEILEPFWSADQICDILIKFVAEAKLIANLRREVFR